MPYAVCCIFYVCLSAELELNVCVEDTFLIYMYIYLFSCCFPLCFRVRVVSFHKISIWLGKSPKVQMFKKKKIFINP